MAEITIKYDDQSVTVFWQPAFKKWKDAVEIGYVDKHTNMEDVAQQFYELAACLNATVDMEIV